MKRSDILGHAFGTDFWSGRADIFEHLQAKDRDRAHVVPADYTNAIFRAVLTFDHLRANLKPGARILDMGCGLGANACYLASFGFQVTAFDASEKGIERGQELARRLGLDNNVTFVQGDETTIGSIDSRSLDAVIGMGFVYYLDEAGRDYTYRQARRVLRSGGILALTLSNALFAAFSLNNTSLDFWANLIRARAPEITDARDRLAAHITVPEREPAPGSISARYGIHADNPLEYASVAKRYGLSLERILYPDSHLLPPFLEAQMEPAKLARMKAETCLQTADDWRGVFMDYEFLAFIRREFSIGEASVVTHDEPWLDPNQAR